MLHKRNFLIVLFLLAFFSVCYATNPTFSVYGPTNVVIPYGQNTETVTYSFSYGPRDQNIKGTIVMVISLDGTVISTDLCHHTNADYMPSTFSITFSQGVHTVKFNLMGEDQATLNCMDPVIYQSATKTVTVNFTIRVQNNFSGGTISYNGSVYNSPSDFVVSNGESITLSSSDQNISGSSYIWNTSGTYNSNWDKILADGNTIKISNDRTATYTIQPGDVSSTFQANLRKICKITFQNNFTSVGNGEAIVVNGTQYNSPTSPFNVIQQNPITASASSHNINGIVYYFDHWSDGSTSDTKTFYPASNTTYTAYFTGIPSKVNFNFGFDQVVGQPIKMHWTDNVNPNITYQIWRTYKGDQIGPIKIATVQKGVQTYTDYAYTFTGGYTDKLLFYDVREYYSVEDTTSPISWHAVYGTGKSLKISVPKDTLSKKVIKNYSLACYPNPFNPSTTINYQLPKDGFVSLKIFDIVGNEVKTLVNGYRSAGSYNVTFNASTLPSGIYFYRIKTNNYFKVKKMLMIK